MLENIFCFFMLKKFKYKSSEFSFDNINFLIQNMKLKGNKRHEE